MVKRTIILPAIILLSFNLWGQQAMNGIEETTYDDIITYQPPSKKFIPIMLQTHKGKLRFGEQDNYAVKPDGTYWEHNDPAYVEIDKKTAQLLYGKQIFVELLKMKLQNEIYNVIDKNLFTKQTSNMYEKDLKSYTAQQHILKLANVSITKKEMLQYFCNDKKEDCIFKSTNNNYYYRALGNITHWGGKKATEFQQLRSYTTFVNKNLGELQTWSQSLLPENKSEGYFVAQVPLYAYDFEKQGYWLKSNMFYGNAPFMLGFRDLEPTNSNERKLAHPLGIQILYPMSPAKAEDFSEKHQRLYLVFDVTLSLSGIHNYQYDKLNTNYTLNSSIISLYTDDSLTQKIGELDINTMTSKTR